MKILVISSEWPTEDHPEFVPFLVNEVNQLRNSGLEIEVFSFSGHKNPTNYIKAWISLRRKNNLNRFDLIHAEWGQSGLLAFPKHLPLVVTFRGSDLEGIVNSKGNYTFTGRLLRIASRFVARFADRVIVVSESLTKYIPNVPYTVLPVCLDTNIFGPMEKAEARNKLKLPLDSKLVLFAANPERIEKRYSLAKKAVELLDGKNELIVTKNIPHDQMALYFNACDVLLITSVHEGSPTIIYEALGCNLPIVSVDVGDVRYRIGNINGCFICEDDSPNEIAHWLSKVLITEERIDGFSKMTEFNTEHFCNKMKEIYESCLYRK